MYMNNRMVKTKATRDHVSNLEKVFTIIRHYEMHLNTKKFIFAIISGKFLGYQVSSRGIKAYPDKITTLVDMRSPHYLKEVQ